MIHTNSNFFTAPSELSVRVSEKLKLPESILCKVAQMEIE